MLRCQGRNDLEGPAIELEPVIADVLGRAAQAAGLPARPHVGLGGDVLRAVRFDGRGGAAARTLRAGYPGWWVRATVLGAQQP